MFNQDINISTKDNCIHNQCISKTLILAGNPNVGKSTVFNALTGQNRHTGNWSGKTVDCAYGVYFHNGTRYIIADIPGCYSLKSRSEDEKCASDVLCFTPSDSAIIICDAEALERNLYLALQICEALSDVILCVNFAKESESKGITIDYEALQKELGIPVLRINARKKKGLDDVADAVEKSDKSPIKLTYGKAIERAIAKMQSAIATVCTGTLSKRYVALRLLEDDSAVWELLEQNCEPPQIAAILCERNRVLGELSTSGIDSEKLDEIQTVCQSRAARRIAKKCVNYNPVSGNEKISRADRILTGKFTGFLIMLLSVSLIFYITLVGANYPSAFLSDFFVRVEPVVFNALIALGINRTITEMLIYGGFRVLGWVVAVMLPPMAIFFPLFTILEDIGYLPRIAFNLDRAFRSCRACGKQALTTCMGFGCNAVGVCGARIIDSPRERLVAILTNSFIPCNGRFPTLICLITVFFASTGRIEASFYLLLTVVFSVLVSMAASRFLSGTFLRGMPSASVFELPSFRRPQFGKIIITSLLTRTLAVLGRAAVVAFPAGVFLWLLTNITIEGTSLVSYLTRFLDPFGRLMGLDGVILTAFILGLPANEIILPIILMLYSSGNVLTEQSNYDAIFTILSENGWSWITAVCAVLFLLMHWPCSTTILTIHKETSSIRWTLAGVLLPATIGIAMCISFNFIVQLIMAVF